MKASRNEIVSKDPTQIVEQIEEIAKWLREEEQLRVSEREKEAERNRESAERLEDQKTIHLLRENSACLAAVVKEGEGRNIYVNVFCKIVDDLRENKELECMSWPNKLQRSVVYYFSRKK